MGYNEYILAMAPIGYWRLGEASGDALDTGSTGVNGSLVNTPTQGATGLLTGDSNKAVTFAAASSQYISIADNNAWSITTANKLTVMAWVSMSALDTGTNQGIIAKGVNTGNQYEWGLYVQDSNGRPAFLIWKLDGTQVLSVDNGTNNTFPASAATFHLVVTIDASSIASTTAIMYVNGLQVGSTTADCTGIANGTGVLRIGEIWNLGMYWKGTIDEVAIFNKVVPAAQIKTLYEVGTAATPLHTSASPRTRRMVSGRARARVA